MALKVRLRNKDVSVHDDGRIFVNGSCAGIKQWKSDTTRYSNLSGREQTDIRGQKLEDALVIKGKL